MMRSRGPRIPVVLGLQAWKPCYFLYIIIIIIISSIIIVIIIIIISIIIIVIISISIVIVVIGGIIFHYFKRLNGGTLAGPWSTGRFGCSDPARCS